MQEIKIFSPLDNSLLGSVKSMSKEEVDKEVGKAKEAFYSWKEMPLSQRADIMYKAADLLVENTKKLADLLMMEVGKDQKSAASEVTRTADFIRFTADTAKSIHGESIQGDTFSGFSKEKIAMVTREPVGVVLAISPFNYPINLAASKIAPALISGKNFIGGF